MQKVQIFAFIGLLLPILLGEQCAKTNLSLPNIIQGLNFHGQIQLNNDILKIGITNFNDGTMYNVEMTNSTLEKDNRRFLFFRNIEQLYDELIINWNLEISPDYGLILPIEVNYKNQIRKVRIEIPLKERKFKNEGQKVHNLLQQMKRMNQQKLRLSRPQEINFKGDEKNSNYKQFEFNKDHSTLKYLGKSQHTIFNHEATLPQTGVFTFKIKVIKSSNNHIFLGVCAKDIKSAVNANAYNHNLFIGYYLSNNHVYGRGTSRVVANPKSIAQGTSVIKTVIDMTRRQIFWYLDDQRLYGSTFWNEMKDLEVYLFVSLQTHGDVVQFV